jgi:membrane-associated protease RseP (regulator of RpoE activity)
LRLLFRNYALPLLLLLASVVTTTVNGARFMQNFLQGLPPVARESDLWPWPWLIRHPAFFATGFSLTLLCILLIHEYGHYEACAAHRMNATVPWVIPAPTLSGTIGAIIRIRTRIPSRNALMDVGIYGPLAGFIASAIAVAAGLLLSVPRPPGAPQSIIRFGGDPLTIRLLRHVIAHWNPSVPSFNQASPHPILVAGWIGLFITALNLIPGGQLDGGHILYALSPRLHRFMTNLLPFLLFLAGTIYWVGWLFWGIFLLIPALRHPKIPIDAGLSRGRVLLGVLGLVIFVLTFTPTPFYDNSLLQLLNIDPFTLPH